MRPVSVAAMPVADTRALRYPEDALDAAGDATDDPADGAAHDPAGKAHAAPKAAGKRCEGMRW